jgi:hypothetical protein
MENLLISKEDEELLKLYRILFDKNSGYFRVYLGKGKYTYLHRLIVNAQKGDIVDHIDRNRQNNTRENLRIVTRATNNYNREVKNKLGRGIYFDKFGNRFRACISHENKTLKLGSFKTLIEAKEAYNKKAVELRGDDAYLHVI